MTHWIGIDVSKHELAVCVMDAHKQTLHSTFANHKQGVRSLFNYLKKRTARGSAVCLEATGVYGEDVAAFLHERGFVVSVVNPLQIKRYAQSQLRRNKTDKLDAEVIADFCRTQEPTPWTPPPPSWLDLRAMVRHMDDLIHMQTQEKQRLDTETSQVVRQQLTDHIAYLEQQINQLQKRIKDHIDQDPDLRQQRDLLNSIPGISDKTSARLLAEIREIGQFDSPGQLVAYAGLNPRLRQSGKYRGQIKISKLGNAAVRNALFMGARRAKRCNPLVRPLVERMQAQGHCPKAITVAVMRKMLHYVFGILKSRQPFDPNYLQLQSQSA